MRGCVVCSVHCDLKHASVLYMYHQPCVCGCVRVDVVVVDSTFVYIWSSWMS